MVIVRFLLRFLLIPLGALAALLAAMLLLLVVSGGKLLALVGADPDATADAAATVLVVGPAMILALASASFAMTTPALIAVAVAEIVAIRSWLYFAATGGIAAWIGWWTMNDVRGNAAILNEPTLIAAAGIVGGLGYWLVAGWNAGFWKPVFATATSPPPNPAAQPPAA
jgi:hypothetical protein